MITLGNQFAFQVDETDGKYRLSSQSTGAMEAASVSLDAVEVELSGYLVSGKRTGSDDIVVDASDRGLVLTSPNGHRWRMTIANNGNVSWSDLDI